MRRRKFEWDERNTEHIGKHGVSRAEAEHVVRNASPPYPRCIGEGKFLVWGQTAAGRYLQVIFVLRRPDNVEYGSMTPVDISALAESYAPWVRVIHARDLTPREKSQYRRSK